jgi:NADH-quinone oxidoreductase subunit L
VSIAGLPIAAGFYSKDAILWKALVHDNNYVPGRLLFAVGLLTAALTSFYAFRSYFLVFWARPRPPVGQVHESPRSMTAVLAVMAAAAVVSGPILGWPALWGGAPLLESFLAPVFAAVQPLVRFTHASAATELGLQLASVLVALAGFALARALYRDLGKTEALLERGFRSKRAGG